MATNFPASQVYGHDHSTNLEYTPSAVAGETLTYGQFCTLSGATVVRCGADPAGILGISEVDSEAAKLLTPNGKIPIRVLDAATTLRMASATTPVAATHIGQTYGITRDGTSGNWLLDTAKTGASARVLVVATDDAAGYFFVRVIAQYLIGDTIIS